MAVPSGSLPVAESTGLWLLADLAAEEMSEAAPMEPVLGWGRGLPSHWAPKV